ncbi:MAG: hypothetical protein FD167_5951 [bacterium]|nr:MAG: hypothetical protein FD167_5951 [bacterium]
MGGFESGRFETEIPGQAEVRSFEITQRYSGKKQTPLIVKLPEADFYLDPRNPFIVTMHDKTPQPELSFWDKLKGKTHTPRTKATTKEIGMLSELIANAKPTQKEQNRRKITNDSREVFSSNTEREVKGLLEKLKQKGEKTVLVFIIDNSIEKTHYIKSDFVEKHAQKSGFGYVVGYKYDGEEAIQFFKAFKQQAPVDLPIVVYLDNNLVNGGDHNPKYRIGMDVIKRIDELCKENGWTMPYLIGGSSDKEPNEALKEAYPDLYVGRIYDFSTLKDPLENLEERLASK